jgi:hypothetical protein
MSKKKKTSFFEKFVRNNEQDSSVFPTASLRKTDVRCSLCGRLMKKHPVGVWIDVIDGVEYFKAPMTSCVFLCSECRKLEDVEEYLILDSYADLVIMMDKYCERFEEIRRRFNVEYKERV